MVLGRLKARRPGTPGRAAPPSTPPPAYPYSCGPPCRHCGAAMPHVCVSLLMRAAPGCATPPHVAHLSRLRQGPAGRPSIPKGVDEGNVGMNVYVKCFEIPDRLRASLNPDECEVLEVDGVPFIDEYGGLLSVGRTSNRPLGALFIILRIKDRLSCRHRPGLASRC